MARVNIEYQGVSVELEYPVESSSGRSLVDYLNRAVAALGYGEIIEVVMKSDKVEEL